MLTFEFTGAEGRMLQTQTLTSGMVGMQVKFLFSPEWEGLRKTAVFTAGEVTRDVVDVSDVAVIPARVLEKPLNQLYVGIYGTNGAGDLVIPTVWVPGPMVKPGADPSGDPSTAPELPVWDRILAMIGSLEELDTKTRENLVAAINEVAQVTRELQPDWNQANRERVDYIKNRTHWMSDGRRAVYWDGDRWGKWTLYMSDLDRWYCHVSDRVPEAQEMIGGSVQFLTGEAVQEEKITADGIIAEDSFFLAASGRVLVVTGGKTSRDGERAYVPAPGIYLWFDHQNPDSYATKVTWGQLRALRLDDRYIPLSVARKKDVGFLMGSDQARLLMTLLGNLDYRNDQSANLDALTRALGIGNEIVGDGDIALIGLRAEYCGGEVPAGTAPEELMGLTVWACYEDGSEESITSYTLSGHIREGSNSIIVIYQGMTTDFEVTGTGRSQNAGTTAGWPVTMELTGCTADWENSYTPGGLPLAIRFAAAPGHTLAGAKVQVTMGGADITGHSYSRGLVTIGAVTGEVVILVNAPAL